MGIVTFTLTYVSFGRNFCGQKHLGFSWFLPFCKCFCRKYITIFWGQLSFYLEDKNLFYVIYPNVMQGLNHEILKIFFLWIFFTTRLWHLGVRRYSNYEFCSDGKGSLYTLHVGYFKHHGSLHTRCINGQARFDKETNENRWKPPAYTSSIWSLARQKKCFEESYEIFSE